MAGEDRVVRTYIIPEVIKIHHNLAVKNLADAYYERTVKFEVEPEGISDASLMMDKAVTLWLVYPRRTDGAS